MITIKEAIDSFSEKIINKFNPQKIILFGSYANGTPTEESDIDLCIITEIKNNRKIDIIRAIRREIMSVASYPLDILVYDKKEFEDRIKVTTTLEYKINNEGIKLY